MTVPAAAAARAFTSVLVANRGEIAVRIVRACRDAGLRSVAVHSDGDADAPVVRLADVALSLGGTRAADTYLDAGKLLAAAAEAGADAVHPGYGFLSENADFAQAVIDAGLVWIGPPPEVVRVLGNKVRARALAAEAGAPLVPGGSTALVDAAEAAAFAREHGLPVAIKAAHGGGGRGMRIARTLEEIPDLVRAATREAAASFGRGECFVESYVEHARHVEAQVLADAYGSVEVVGTRDCTLQRRFQKLVEEAPAPFLDSATVAQLERCAADIAKAAGYVNAGTVEFLLSPAGELSFLEVNTRLQVEHSVTEASSDLDLVRSQFSIAAGLPLEAALGPVLGRRHAVEFRINAEDPASGFAPSTGTITCLRVPAGPGVRVDSGVELGSVVGGEFDSLLAKLVVSGRDRTEALERARRALDEFEIDGVRTTLQFCRDVVRDQAFTAPDGLGVHTRWIEDDYVPSAADGRDGAQPVPAVRIGNRWLPVHLPGLADAVDGRLAQVLAQTRARVRRADDDADAVLSSPMQGTVVRLGVAEGEQVRAGDAVAVVEAMKMENQLRAPHDGRVSQLAVAVGDTVAQGAPICRIETD